MRVAVAFILAVISTPSLALDIGVGIGVCGTSHSQIPFCQDGEAWHVYITHDIWRYKGFSLGIEGHHYSRLESSDFDPDESGTDSFDYGGVYLQYSF